MGHLSYEDSKAKVLKIITVLAIITITEVLIALAMKGHILGGALSGPGWLLALIMIVMSFTKAYLIIYEFMHMKYEVGGLVKSVLLPTLLLVWAIIAFFWEGADWGKRRSQIERFNNETIEDTTKQEETTQEGMLYLKPDDDNVFKG